MVNATPDRIIYVSVNLAAGGLKEQKHNIIELIAVSEYGTLWRGGANDEGLGESYNC